MVSNEVYKEILIKASHFLEYRVSFYICDCIGFIATRRSMSPKELDFMLEKMQNDSKQLPYEIKGVYWSACRDIKAGWWDRDRALKDGVDLVGVKIDFLKNIISRY